MMEEKLIQKLDEAAEKRITPKIIIVHPEFWTGLLVEVMRNIETSYVIGFKDKPTYRGIKIMESMLCEDVEVY